MGRITFLFFFLNSIKEKVKTQIFFVMFFCSVKSHFDLQQQIENIFIYFIFE
jgi:hypothetical protein